MSHTLCDKERMHEQVVHASGTTVWGANWPACVCA